MSLYSINCRNGGRTDVTYTMDPTLEKTEIPGTRAVPSQHKFILQGVGQQNLAVFSLSSRAPKGIYYSSLLTFSGQLVYTVIFPAIFPSPVVNNFFSY